MKILEDKTLQIVNCDHCDSKLEISGRDILSSCGDYGGTPYTYRYFYCPCCGKRNGISID